MFSTTLLPANKFPAHYSSGTIKRSGAPTYFKTQLDQFTDVTTFANTGAREYIVGLETETELTQTVRMTPKSNAEGMWGAPALPLPASMNREVLKWLQSLDLSHSVRNIRRDAANGFLVAEICSRYHPNDIHMPGFENGQNTCVKVDNWKQLQRFFATHELKVPGPLMEGVLKGLHGSAVEMVELLYEIFTGKRVQQMPVIEVEEETTDPRKRRNTRKEQLEATIPGLTPGSRLLRKDLPHAPAVQFGAVRLTHLDNATAARQRVAGGGAASPRK